jgi:hypothetical protein
VPASRRPESDVCVLSFRCGAKVHEAVACDGRGHEELGDDDVQVRDGGCPEEEVFAQFWAMRASSECCRVFWSLRQGECV